MPPKTKGISPRGSKDGRRRRNVGDRQAGTETAAKAKVSTTKVSAASRSSASKASAAKPSGAAVAKGRKRSREREASYRQACRAVKGRRADGGPTRFAQTNERGRSEGGTSGIQRPRSQDESRARGSRAGEKAGDGRAAESIPYAGPRGDDDQSCTDIHPPGVHEGRRTDRAKGRKCPSKKKRRQTRHRQTRRRTRQRLRRRASRPPNLLPWAKRARRVTVPRRRSSPPARR